MESSLQSINLLLDHISIITIGAGALIISYTLAFFI